MAAWLGGAPLTVAGPGPPDEGVRSFQAGAAEVWLRRGIEARSDSCEQALSCFRKTLELHPDHPEALSLAAEELVHLGRLDEAHGLLIDGFSRGGDPGLAFDIARLLGRTPERDDAVRDFLATVDTAVAAAAGPEGDPPAIALFAARAELRSWTGDFTGAQADFERCLADLEEAHPHRELVSEGLAVAYNREAFRLVDEDQTEQAIFLIKRAMDLAPQWVGLHVNLGRMFMELGKMSKAREEFERAITGDEEDPVAWFNLGHLQREVGETEAAVVSLAKVLDLEESYPDVRPELAAAYHDLHRFEDAVRLLKEELAEDDSCTACNHNLGLAHLELERPGDAERHFRRAVDLDPSYFRARYNLAGALVRLGRHDEAMKALITAHDLDAIMTGEWLSEDRVEFAAIAGRAEFQGLLVDR